MANVFEVRAQCSVLLLLLLLLHFPTISSTTAFTPTTFTPSAITPTAFTPTAITPTAFTQVGADISSVCPPLPSALALFLTRVCNTMYGQMAMA